jgi:menaquinone-specific isochorismate synthase
MSISISQQRRDAEHAATPLTRVVVPAPGATPEAFLSASGTPRGFWRRGSTWCAWSGSVLGIRVEAGAEGGPIAAVAREAAARLAGADEGSGPARWHGGLAFHPDHHAEGVWADFPAARFDLPVAELVGGAGVETRLVLTAAGAGPEARPRALRKAEALAARLAGRPGDSAASIPGGIRDTAEAVSRETWRGGVEAALRAIREGRFRKVVLARPLDVELGAPPGAATLVRRLRTREAGSFPFLFEPRPGAIFFGASPELVALRSGDRLHAMAVAGTAPRSADAAEDERLGRELLESAKDRTEHAIGVRDMRERLASLLGDPEVDEQPHLLRLRGIQHLRTDLSVRAAGGRGVLDLLEVMHPTAAVSGYPREPAAAFLRERESFERGWYAGPVGWFDASGEGAFAPALRCALLRGERARLFAGAGLVEGSDPDREWEETALKLEPMLEILAGGPEA